MALQVALEPIKTILIAVEDALPPAGWRELQITFRLHAITTEAMRQVSAAS